VPQATRRYDPRIGPVISVAISDPFSDRPDDEFPRSEKVTMLIDTGASDSSISGVIADHLSLPVLGLHDVSGFGSNNMTYQYLFDLELLLDSSHQLADWKLLRFDTDYNKIQGILGRDFLALGMFSIDGQQQEFSISI